MSQMVSVTWLVLGFALLDASMRWTMPPARFHCSTI